jgi:hypothetical protein
MHSAPDRHILLDPAFRVVGIAIVNGTPIAGVQSERAFTIDFGS